MAATIRHSRTMKPSGASGDFSNSWWARALERSVQAEEGMDKQPVVVGVCVKKIAKVFSRS